MPSLGPSRVGNAPARSHMNTTTRRGRVTHPMRLCLACNKTLI